MVAAISFKSAPLVISTNCAFESTQSRSARGKASKIVFARVLRPSFCGTIWGPAARGRVSLLVKEQGLLDRRVRCQTLLCPFSGRREEWPRFAGSVYT